MPVHLLKHNKIVQMSSSILYDTTGKVSKAEWRLQCKVNVQTKAAQSKTTSTMGSEKQGKNPGGRECGLEHSTRSSKNDVSTENSAFSSDISMVQDKNPKKPNCHHLYHKNGSQRTHERNTGIVSVGLTVIAA